MRRVKLHGMGKPVIFMARSDHFKRKNDDDFGNFRIHFDLQMKNIIKWIKPTPTVKKQLESRINIVTKPLLEALSKSEIIRKAQASFSKLPQKEKFLTIVQPIENELKKMKFRLEEKSQIYRDNILAIKKMDQSSIVVWCLAEASFTKARLIDIRNIGPHSSRSMSDFFKKLKIDTKQNITLHILCCSLRNIPESRIEDALPYFWPLEQLKIYSYYRKSSSYGTFHVTHIHFLDKIDSILTIKDQLEKHLPLIGKLDDRNKNNFL